MNSSVNISGVLLSETVGNVDYVHYLQFDKTPDMIAIHYKFIE